MDLATCFSPDYATARDRFRRLATSRGASMHALAIGPGDLTCDAAVFGDGPRVVVASSGLHGVEGFFGSAVQLAWLEAARPPTGVCMLLLHALNPFGFANMRRGNEDGVDLNRNLLRPGEAYRGSSVLYGELDALLNPPTPPRFDLFGPRLLGRVLRHGTGPVRHAIAAGQYDYPRGLFFGGTGPSATMRALAEFLPRWLDPAERIVHLDFHTGLGTYAGYRLLSSQPPGSESVARLQATFGDVVEATSVGTTAYVCRGGIDEWVQQRWGGRVLDSVCAEFGTYGPLHVLAATRAENRAHWWGGDPATKRRLIEAFNPADLNWRRAVVRQGVALMDRAAR